MHMTRDHPEYDWTMGHESYYFLIALQELQKMLKKEHIGWIFNDQCNVIQGRFTHCELSKMAKYVGNALKELKGNNGHTSYEVWRSYFEI